MRSAIFAPAPRPHRHGLRRRGGWHGGGEGGAVLLRGAREEITRRSKGNHGRSQWERSAVEACVERSPREITRGQAAARLATARTPHAAQRGRARGRAAVGAVAHAELAVRVGTPRPQRPICQHRERVRATRLPCASGSGVCWRQRTRSTASRRGLYRSRGYEMGCRLGWRARSSWMWGADGQGAASGGDGGGGGGGGDGGGGSGGGGGRPPALPPRPPAAGATRWC